MEAATLRPVGEIASYHAHVYFDPESEWEHALALRAGIGERFAVRLGRVWDRPVGPHSRAMYQVAFAPAVFHVFVPWLMLNNGGLSILVHPNTTNPRRDHLHDAVWIGTALSLAGEVLPDDQAADLAGEPNTTPHKAP
ncbi:DOPA 4,5-dioxygenase family protein [Sphingosinicella sp. BN140058]|uniref:DOPA 4,5-dioxygenase family protein n=1 Tax=Sphingosinicella sp. BN140058 TaxID=1892855 RepID=UPI0010129AE2|nr:DOPA 4,5-dioxygenase family protein [Sphingosinicella sp. BN140058]QAY77016.1 aromatic ring-cleaving dioxygenase [Sphingosinicella sp. BN140058]